MSGAASRICARRPRLTATEVDLEVVTRNQDGAEVLRGYASAKVDS